MIGQTHGKEHHNADGKEEPHLVAERNACVSFGDNFERKHKEAPQDGDRLNFEIDVIGVVGNAVVEGQVRMQ